jgi:hypothetical protein
VLQHPSTPTTVCQADQGKFQEHFLITQLLNSYHHASKIMFWINFAHTLSAADKAGIGPVVDYKMQTSSEVFTQSTTSKLCTHHVYTHKLLFEHNIYQLELARSRLGPGWKAAALLPFFGRKFGNLDISRRTQSSREI